MEKPIVLGVDIGGSHITAALVDLESEILIEDSVNRSVIDSKESKEEILSVCCRVINSAFGDVPIDERRIGIAMPGPFDYEKGISLIKDQDKFKSLYLTNLKEELSTRLTIAQNQIKFINDAAAFMQGELFNGAAKGCKNAIGLTLGTGLGSAIAINGIAKDADLWNSKFLNGIAEDYLSTKWFVRKYKTLTGRDINGAKELASLFGSDPYSKQIFNEFGRALGHFLADFIKENHSEVVVLGGNIAQAFSLFAPSLIDNLKAYQLHTEIRVTKLKEHAPLIGAASTWKVMSTDNQ